MTDPRLLSATIELPKELLQYELKTNEDLVLEMPEQSVIATSTFYKPREGKWDPVTKMRADLALRMMKLATEAGYLVICVDENSDADWCAEAAKTGAQIYDPDFAKYNTGSSNMGRCRRQAMDLGSQVDKRPIVIWLEPEKAPAVRAFDGSLPLAQASTPIIENLADVILPRRADNGASYPPMQQFMERAGNTVASNLLLEYSSRTGLQQEEAEKFAQYLDHFCGPKIFSRETVPYFAKYGELAQSDPEFNDQWGSVHYPPFMALLEGERVGGVAFNYVHPAQQTKAEAFNLKMDMKRYEQGDKLTRTLALLLNRNLKARNIDNLLPL